MCVGVVVCFFYRVSCDWCVLFVVYVLCLYFSVSGGVCVYFFVILCHVMGVFGCCVYV